MNKLQKSIFLFLALWPWCYAILFGVTLGLIFKEQNTFSDVALGILFAFHALTLGISLTGITFYMFNLYRNPQIQGNMKMMWAVGILFLSPFVLFPYWRNYVR